MSFMQEAIRQAYEGIENGHGGPFGSVVVLNGKIVGRGHNRVLLNKDPTCHGEIEAIRDACRNLNTHDLSECELYTTAEPCPMCLGAILWANIRTVYSGCNRQDTAQIGFRDDAFYDYLYGKDTSALNQKTDSRDECLKLFEDYRSTSSQRY